MTVVTPTDRPKSVRNRCVIEVFGGVFVSSFSFRIFWWYRGFDIGLSQISFFFSLLIQTAIKEFSWTLGTTYKLPEWYTKLICIIETRTIQRLHVEFQMFMVGIVK